MAKLLIEGLCAFEGSSSDGCTSSMLKDIRSRAIAREKAIEAEFRDDPPSDILGFCKEGFRQLASGELGGRRLTVFCLQSRAASDILLKLVSPPVGMHPSEINAYLKTPEYNNSRLAWGVALAAEAVAAVEREGDRQLESLYPVSVADRNGDNNSCWQGVTTPRGSLLMALHKLRLAQTECLNGIENPGINVPETFNAVAARVEEAYGKRMFGFQNVSGTIPRMTCEP